MEELNPGAKFENCLVVETYVVNASGWPVVFETEVTQSVLYRLLYFPRMTPIEIFYSDPCNVIENG
jgi:hypothetical protein